MKSFKTFPVRLALGLSLVCILPSLLSPNWQLFSADLTDELAISVAFLAVAFSGTMMTMRRLNWFPGTRSTLAFLPVLLSWCTALGVLLLAFHLPYSMGYLLTGFVFATVFLLVQSMLLNRLHTLRMAFVPLGRAEFADATKGAEWIRLNEPEIPQGYKLNAIVADLHSPALTDAWQKFLANCTLQHMPVYNIRQVEESLTGRVKIRHMYENNLGSLLPSPTYMTVKYLLESALILVSLPITLPVMLLTALLVKLEDGGSVFYNQERVGYRGKPFTMFKFRSMTENKAINQETTTQKGDARITRIGRVIRKLRIDELPQLLNVLRGEMSLIGPRAEYKKFADELEKQVPFYQYRHIVKPGISGWAQVMHGYATGAEETQIKIEHDFYYIKNFSFWLDLLIFFKTIKTMATGFGAR